MRYLAVLVLLLGTGCTGGGLGVRILSELEYQTEQRFAAAEFPRWGYAQSTRLAVSPAAAWQAVLLVVMQNGVVVKIDDAQRQVLVIDNDFPYAMAVTPDGDRARVTYTVHEAWLRRHGRPEETLIAATPEQMMSAADRCLAAVTAQAASNWH